MGDLAPAVLDVRLEGGDVKSLISLPELDSPSSYRIKTSPSNQDLGP